MSRVRHIKRKLHAEDEIAWEQFDLGTMDFAAAMVKREAPGPFEAAPIIQGKFDGSGVPDRVTFPRGNLIGNQTQIWYANLDPYQGSIVFWITPEWEGDDGNIYTVLRSNQDTFRLLKLNTDTLYLEISGQTLTADVSGWTAGTTYQVAIRWDTQNTLDGTNYLCISIDDAHSFGGASAPGVITPGPTNEIGWSNTTGGIRPANAIIEAPIFYRRPLFDGTYGVRPMNGNQYAGDEINAIWNAGAGRDPTLVTGSEDVVLCVPTDSDDGGELTTGAGEAWSWPVGDNLLDVHGAWDGGFPGTDRAVEFDGADTVINCGSDVDIDDIHDAEFTAEAWVRVDVYGGSGGRIFDKTGSGAAGWFCGVPAIGGNHTWIVYCAGTNALSAGPSNSIPDDGKWHHIVMYFNDAGDRKIYIAVDGIWLTPSTQTAGIGAVVTDVGEDLYIGIRSDGARQHQGGIAWAAISNNDRHSHGTDFIPPRALPADDANYLAIWGMEEGTGTDIDNTGDQGGAGSGAANRDGTLANGSWSSIWEQDGTPVIPQSVVMDGITSGIIVADAAELTDLQDGDLTFDIDVRTDSAGEGNVGVLIGKVAGDAGWICSFSIGALGFRVNAGTDSRAEIADYPLDSRWHNVRGTFSDAGDRKCRIYLDGILQDTGDAAVGAINTDAGIDVGIGCRSSGANSWDGAIGRVRLSNNLRSVTTETAFAPNGRVNPPNAADANTMMQLDMDEGAGAAPQDGSGEGNHGVITDGVWRNTPDMAIDEPGAAIYGPKGYNLGSDGVNDGTYEEKIVVAEKDYVVFPVISFGASGRARAQIRIRDVSNAADVVTFPGPLLYGQHGGANNVSELAHPTGKWPWDQLVGWTVYNITDGSSGTVTANTDVEVTATLGGGTDDDWDTNDYFLLRAPNGYDNWPWQESFCFQTPAGCTLLRVYIENPNGEGVLQVHQVQVLPNLAPSGGHESLTGGNPDLITGWSSDGLDAGDTEASSTGDGIIHSGDEAMQWNNGASASEGMIITAGVAKAINQYQTWGFWTFGNGTETITFSSRQSRTSAQDGSTDTFTLPGNILAAWVHTVGVGRFNVSNTEYPKLDAKTAGASRFTDDVYIIDLDAIALTVTPASEANSLEGTGIRIDGLDTVTDTPTLLRAHQGYLEFGAAPRHPPAEVESFGQIREYMVTLYEDANNWLEFYRHDDNLQLRCVAQGAAEINDIFDITGDWDPGVRDVFQLAYGAGGVRIWRNGVHIMTALGSAVFATAFTSIEWGTDENQRRQFDGVISPA